MTQADEQLRRLDRLAWLLDNSIRVPGTQFRIGLDGLIGLVPGIGDFVGALFSSYLVAEAARGGASASLLARMGLNVAIESVIGLVPLAGDLFDMAFKANVRNVALLRRHALEPARAKRSNRLVVGLVALLIIAFIFAILLLAIAVFRWAWQMVTGTP